jgi:hypothetical protein
MLNITAARQHLEALYGNSLKGKACLSIKEEAWFDIPYDDIQALMGEIDTSSDADFFVTPCTFRLDQAGHFKRQADLAFSMPGAWFDFDVQDPVHTQSALPTREEAEAFIASLPLKPTLVIWSGHGYHLYWLFDKPFIIETPEDRAKAQHLSRGFQRALAKEGTARGWVFDNTSDLARALRLAGSMNHKVQPPVEVTIVAHDPDLRYEFDGLFDQYAAQEPATTAFSGTRTLEGETLGADANRILEECAFLRHCRDDAETLPEPEWYAMLSILARCEGGRELCHELSKLYPGYNEEETDRKISQALESAGPRTCADIREKFGGFCEGCPHQVTSPICLGAEKGQTAYPLAIPEEVDSGKGQVFHLQQGLGIQTIRIPYDWSVTKEGLIHWEGSGEQKRPVQIAPVPVFIVSRRLNQSTDTEEVTLAWPRDRHWKRITVSRGEIADHYRLLQNADKGLPVNSRNAIHLVEFLCAIENLNLSDFPVTQASEILGWHQTESGPGFVLGDRYIAPDGAIVADNSSDRVVFSPTSEGIEQLGRAFSCKGELGPWLEVIERIRPFPVPMLTLLTALASPLLKVMEVSGFCLDLAYVTSSGKTTCQRVAVSIFGCPVESSPDTALFSWNATRVSIERSASVLNGLPVIMNDSRQAKSQEEVVQVVYDVTNGQGRGRGSKQGLQKRSPIQSTLISSGEEAIVDGSEAGGVRTRVISATLAPFGDSNQAELVNWLNRTVKCHYGHAGVQFIGFLLRNRDQWEAWRQELDELAARYTQKAEGNPFVGRMAQPFALIELAARLASEAWNLRELLPSPVDALWEALIQETRGADRSEEALKYLVNCCVANQGHFWQKGHGELPAHVENWGRWDVASGNWDHLYILPSKLARVLEDGGFEAKAARRMWLKNGWIGGDKDRPEAKTVKVGSFKTRCVAIRRKALEDLGILTSEGTFNTELPAKEGSVAATGSLGDFDPLSFEPFPFERIQVVAPMEPPNDDFI